SRSSSGARSTRNDWRTAMPLKDNDQRKAYMKGYKQRNRTKITARRRELYRQSHEPPNFWSAGHQSQRICLNCDGSADLKPLPNCTEQRHMDHFKARCSRNNAYRTRKKGEARLKGETWNKEDQKKVNERNKRTYLQLRNKVLERLGLVCAQCGFADVRA